MQIIENYKRKAAEESNIQKTSLEQFFIQGKKRQGALYEQISEYKNAVKELSKYYSLINTTMFMRIIRFCIGGVCILSGSYMLVLAGLHSFVVVNEVYSFILAAAVMIFGACLIRMGFLRGMVAAAASAAAAILIFLDYQLLSYCFGRSLFIFSSVVFLSVWIIFGVIYLVYHHISCEKAMSICIYPFGEGLKGADLDLNELLPIQKYTQFTAVICDWEGNPDRLMNLVGEVKRISDREKIIFCGFNLSNRGQFVLYFYLRKEWQSHSVQCRKLLCKLKKAGANMRYVLSDKDEQWYRYINDVYPDHLSLLSFEALLNSDAEETSQKIKSI